MTHTQQTESWSGEGVGTSAESFLARINRDIPEYPPGDAAEAVICALCERLPGGLVQELRVSLEVSSDVGRGSSFQLLIPETVLRKEGTHAAP